MLLLGSVRDSMSGTYLWEIKMTKEEFAQSKPWQVAKDFHVKMGSVPVHIIVYDGEEKVAEWYEGNDYPAEGGYP